MTIEEYNKYIRNLVNEENVSDIFINKYIEVKKENIKKAVLYSENKNIFFELIKKLNIEIKDVDFSNEDFSEISGDFSEFKFLNCIFNNVNFTSSYLDAFEFYNCSFNKSKFYNANLECSLFIDCECKSADFTKAHLMASSIYDSDWTGANISGANLLEVYAENWIINNLILNENTAINEAEFVGTDWHNVDVSNLAISLEQVGYFLQNTNGSTKLKVYSSYKKSLPKDVEDYIYNVLINEYNQRIISNEKSIDVDDTLTFISYASENAEKVTLFYEKEKENRNFWIDISLVKTEKLKDQIDNIIKTCGTAIVFLTKDYIFKAWTRYELLLLSDEFNKRNGNIILLDEDNLFSQIKENIKIENCIVVNNEFELIKILNTNKDII